MRTYLLASTRALRSAVPCLGAVLTAVGCAEQNIEVEETKASVQGDVPAVIEDWSGVGAIGGVCSGVLIAPKVFVFAAHCGVPQRTVVFLDASETQTIVELALGYCRSAAPDHDLAFCQVNGDEAPATSIPFAPAAVYGELRVDDPLLLAGWGVPGGNLGEHPGVVTARITKVTESELVVGATADAGTCPGDSGGPAVLLRDDGRRFVVGILSYGVGQACGEGHYVPSPLAMRWVMSETEIDLSGLSFEPRPGAWAEAAIFKEPQEGMYFALVHPQRTALIDYRVILPQGFGPSAVTISLDTSSVREDWFAPYAGSIPVTEGLHVLSARAVDSSGRLAEGQVSVKVGPDKAATCTSARVPPRHGEWKGGSLCLIALALFTWRRAGRVGTLSGCLVSGVATYASGCGTPSTETNCTAATVVVVEEVALDQRPISFFVAADRNAVNCVVNGFEYSSCSEDFAVASTEANQVLIELGWRVAELYVTMERDGRLLRQMTALGPDLQPVRACEDCSCTVYLARM